MTSSRYDDDLLRDVLRYAVESSDVTTDEPFSEDSIESPSRASLTPNKNLPYHIRFGVNVLPQVSGVSPLRALQKQALRPASPVKIVRESEISDSESESDMSVTSDEVDNLASSVLDSYDRERHPPQLPSVDELRLDLREDDVESWVLCSSSEDSILGGSSVDKPPKAHAQEDAPVATGTRASLAQPTPIPVLHRASTTRVPHLPRVQAHFRRDRVREHCGRLPVQRQRAGQLPPQRRRQHREWRSPPATSHTASRAHGRPKTRSNS